jgi:hypothetical protein
MHRKDAKAALDKAVPGNEGPNEKQFLGMPHGKSWFRGPGLLDTSVIIGDVAAVLATLSEVVYVMSNFMSRSLTIKIDFWKMFSQKQTLRTLNTPI